MAAAADLAIGAIKEIVKEAIEQLKSSWEAYRTNYYDAQAVFEYAERILSILEPWALDNSLNGALGPRFMDNLEQKAFEIQQTAEDVQKEVEMAKTLDGKMRRFFMADSTRTKLRKLQNELKQVLDDLEQHLNLERQIEQKLVGRVVETIENAEARAFWKRHAGSNTWSMPFTQFVEFYNVEMRKNGSKRVTARKRQGVGAQGSRWEDRFDVVVQGGPSCSDVFAWLGACFRERRRETGGSSSQQGSHKKETAPIPDASQADAPPARKPYRVLTKDDKEALLYAICSSKDEPPVKLGERDEEVTVSTLNSFVSIYGFPFDPLALPEPPASIPTHFSITERLHLATVCMSLQQEFSLPTTHTALSKVRESLDNTAEDIRQALTSRLQPSHSSVEQEMRGLYALQMSPEGCSVDDESKYNDRQLRCFAADWLTRTGGARFTQLDQDRRVWSFFLQRYMTLWRLCDLTQDLFEDIDFPGTGRIITFLVYCEPLDEANFRINIQKSTHTVKAPSELHRRLSEEWESARPKVYPFLRMLLRWKDELESKKTSVAKLRTDLESSSETNHPSKPTRESRAPLPVGFGGLAAPPFVPQASQVADGAAAAQTRPLEAPASTRGASEINTTI